MGKIDKNDSRLGNIIGNRDGKPMEVNDGTISGWDKCEIILGVFKPIYMSNKWALKFGFMSLQVMAKHYEKESKYPFQISKRQLKSLRVYEAQNLYKSLTGQELKI